MSSTLTGPEPELRRASSSPPPNPSRAADAGHIGVLDGIRGLAILMVMFNHYALNTRLSTPIDKAFYYTAKLGWMGVDLFFVLSGFLITGILLNAKRKPHYFRNFYMRRTVRIFPLYYAFLAVVFLIIPRITGYRSPELQHVDPYQTFYWTYLTNWFFAYKNEIPAFSHLWSLAIEEQFYLLWPAVVLVLSERSLKRCALTCIAAALAFRLVCAWQHSGSIIPYVLTPMRMDTLAAGAYLVLRVREPDGLARIQPLARYAALSSIGVMAGIMIYQKGYGHTPLVTTAGFSCNAILACSVIAMSLAPADHPFLNRAFSTRTLQFFGKYSYCLYMVHMLVEETLAKRVNANTLAPEVWGSALPGRLVFAGMCIGASVAIALVSWHAYEKQWLKLKRFFP